jgi:hypothetical protein
MSSLRRAADVSHVGAGDVTGLIVGWVVSFGGFFAAIRRASSRVFVAYPLWETLQTRRQAFGAVPDRTLTQLRWLFNFEKGAAAESQEQVRTLKPFRFEPGDAISAPYGFLTTLAAMATALSFKGTWRFTMRQLLLATAAIAAILAAAFGQCGGLRARISRRLSRRIVGTYRTAKSVQRLSRVVSESTSAESCERMHALQSSSNRGSCE